MVTVVRQARPSDREAVVATIVAAFARDTAWDFMVGHDYERIAPLFAGALFDLRVDVGHVWIADDAAAVSLWEGPGDMSLSSDDAASQVWDRYRAEAGELAWIALQAYDDAVLAAMPSTPFWYLGVLATRPEQQGRGLARSVVSPVLDLADRDGLPVCLETSNPSNKQIYARLGFTVAADIVVEGGPPTWWMVRPSA